MEDAKKLLAAVKFSRIEFTLQGGQTTAKSDRALRGLSRHSFPRRRVPTPPATLEVGMAVGRRLQHLLQTRTLPAPLQAPPSS